MSKDLRTRRKDARRSRRDAAIARTREEILMAAARVLGRSGLHAVSMQDIAREVGFTAPALYSYFESKEAIFSELSRTLAREMASTFEGRPRPGTPLRDLLGPLLRRQLELVDRRRDVFVAFMALRMRGEAMVLGKQARGTAPSGPYEHLQRLAGWLRHAGAGPVELGSADVEEAAGLLMGIVWGFLVRWLHSAATERLADQTDRILDLFFHGIVGPRKGQRVRRPALPTHRTESHP